MTLLDCSGRHTKFFRPPTTLKNLMRAGLSAVLLCSALIFLASFSGAFGCTIVMAARDGLVLVENNEDRDHPQAIVTFIPATETITAGSYSVMTTVQCREE